jgi:hypothetical protein
MVMAGTTALLTVRGAQSSVDLQVPVDVPIAELVPTLLVTLGMASGNRLLDAPTVWGLGRAQATAPLDAQATLRTAGILDGEELVLQAMANWHTQHAALGAQPGAAEGISVTWHAIEDWSNT